MYFIWLDPNDWSSEDVYEYIVHLYGGKYSQYARDFSQYNGHDLLTLNEDQFRSIVPGDAGTAIYNALKGKERDAKSTNSDSGSGLSVAVIAGLGIGGVLILIVGTVVTYKLIATTRRKRRGR